MDEESDQVSIRRILVALDASNHSMAALEAAARLARSMGAELQGLFVEDINWFRISRHPLTKEISSLTGNIHSLQEDHMERQVKALARRMEKLMQRVSEISKIDYSFKSVRGGVEKQILDATENVDLITLGRVGQSMSRGEELGKTTRYILKESDKPVLLLQQGLKIGYFIIVVYDGSPESRRGLHLARTIALQAESKIKVISFEHNVDDAEDRRREIHELLDQWNLKAPVSSLRIPEAMHLGQMIHEQNGGLIISSRNQPLFQGRALQKVIKFIKCPLLLMK